VWSLELGVPSLEGFPKNGKEACSQSAMDSCLAVMVCVPAGMGVMVMWTAARATALAASRAMSAYSLVGSMGSSSNNKNHGKASSTAMMGPRSSFLC